MDGISGRAGILRATLKVGLLVAIVILTNAGFGERLALIVTDGRIVTFMFFSGIWLVALAALLAAAFHPSLRVRLLWSIPLALAGALAFGYRSVQGSEFLVFDLLNFWSARHEAGRAMAFFSGAILPAIIVFALGVCAIAMPPGLFATAGWPARAGAAMLPALPVILIAAVVLYREGKGSEGLPKQFAPIAQASLAAYKISTAAFPERRHVRLQPRAPLAHAIVMVVDESIRADSISLTPGNRLTPEMAAGRERWVDFGPAAAAGNCSNISNALLRFMARRHDLVRSALTSPTVWQYARRAGYRTVYIDAQAGFITVYGKLQNFMTPGETLWIDRLHKLEAGQPAHQLDDELMRLVLEELAIGDRVFIYANKNGAHFPYADNAPPHLDLTGPQAVTPAGAGGSGNGQPASYARAVAWSTDRTMARLVRESRDDRTAIVYTSDHGQHFSPNRLTHCSGQNNVAPQEGIVPLMVSTGDTGLQARFSAAAERLQGRASHFAIAPTLLELMGYAPVDVAAIYDESLLGDIKDPPRFVSGDIFGLFGGAPAWHDANLELQKRPGSPEIISDNRIQPAIPFVD